MPARAYLPRRNPRSLRRTVALYREDVDHVDRESCFPVRHIGCSHRRLTRSLRPRCSLRMAGVRIVSRLAVYLVRRWIDPDADRTVSGSQTVWFLPIENDWAVDGMAG